MTPLFNNIIQQLAGISHPDQLPLLDMKHLEGLHFHLYWKDVNNKYHGANDRLAVDVGLIKGIDVSGYSDTDFWPQDVNVIKQNDTQVIYNKKAHVFVESAVMRDGQLIRCISHKTPWQCRSKKIAGIMGLSLLTVEPVNIGKSKLLNKRQLDCLYYLARGFSQKEIGHALSISPRTVEHHLDAIKIKLNCFSRSELVTEALKMHVIKNRLTEIK